MNKINNTPDYVFETSWEVCNKVGGIYTVLSSKALTMRQLYGDNLVFIGPDIWKKQESPWFAEDRELHNEWKSHLFSKTALRVRVGRWNVPGNPISILVDFSPLSSQKDNIYKTMWERYQVNSLHAYGDYEESCMFAYSTGLIIENFYNYYKLDDKKVIAHFNEWMLGFGELHVKSVLPKVATVFTTHATTVGRSIAGNGKPLYSYLTKYDGNQMARELNVEAKHSIEKAAAQNADCFTTVSEITAKEARSLLEVPAFVTPNGFEKDFIPTGKEFEKKRKEARKALINVTEKLLGHSVEDDALLVATSGRYEYRNKGIDVFIDAMNRLNHVAQLQKDVVAFVMVPAWIDSPREDLKKRIEKDSKAKTPLDNPYITHWLHNMDSDSVLNQIRYLNLQNRKEDRVKVIFVPSYLNGDDGIFDKTYYDLLIGLDVTVFPSYYEPWGYTPHESIAFSVPAITTSLAGFGMWMLREGDNRGMDDGAEVIFRGDFNFMEVSEDICNLIFDMTTKSEEQEKILRQFALDRAALADWKHFFEYYKQAYSIALDKAAERTGH